MAEHPAAEDVEDEEEAEDHGQDAHVKDHAEGHGGIGEDAVHGEMEHLLHGELRHARMARRSDVFHGGLPVSHIPDNAADEAAVLPEAAESQDGLPVHEAEVRAARADRAVRDGVDDRVVPGRSDALHEARVLRGGADGLHDVVPFLPLPDEFRDERRRVLHVPVHGDDRVAVGEIHAAGDGNLVAEIPRKRNGPHMGIRRGERAELLLRAVRGSVIDVEDLVIHAEVLHHAGHCIVEIDDVIFFIVYRGDDRNHGKLLISRHFSYYNVFLEVANSVSIT